VNLRVPRISTRSCQNLGWSLPFISEVGLDMGRWSSEKQFSSFLGLCPNNLITGDKIFTASHPQGLQPGADTSRLCAQSLTHSKSALGAKYRRLRARLGAPKAIVAMAHHLARLVYRMLRYGEKYVEKGIEHYEHKFRLQRMCSTSRFLY
jgi:transposase